MITGLRHCNPGKLFTGQPRASGKVPGPRRWPPSQARLAEAARAIKAGRFDEAAEALAKVRKVSDPPMFRVMLLDPYFHAERWRPGFAAIYKEAFESPLPPTR